MVRFAREGVTEKHPNSAIKRVEVVRGDAVAIYRCQAFTDGLFKAFVTDGALLLLRPAEQLVSRGDAGEEVPLRFAFPQVALGTVELEVVVCGDSVIESSSAGRQ